MIYYYLVEMFKNTVSPVDDMTTIVGIKTDSCHDGIVLAADTQLNYYADDDTSVAKRPIHKIIYNGSWAIAQTGVATRLHYDFERMLLGRKRGFPEEKVMEMIARAVNNYDLGSKYLDSHFPEVNRLNTLHRRSGAQIEELASFIFATRHPRLSLWEIDEMGNLKPAPQELRDFEYISLGSGSKEALKYMTEQEMRGTTDPNSIDIAKAIDLAVGALHAAQEDAFTGGLDLVVVTAEKVIAYGDRIKTAIARAEEEEIDRIKKEFTKEEVK